MFLDSGFNFSLHCSEPEPLNMLCNLPEQNAGQWVPQRRMPYKYGLLFRQALSGFLSQSKGTQVLAQSCCASSTKYGSSRQGLNSIQHRVPEDLLWTECVSSKFICDGIWSRGGNQIMEAEPSYGISVLIRKHHLSLIRVRTQQESGHQEARKQASPDTESADTVVLGFPAFRTVRNQCLLFKPPQSLVFAITARADNTPHCQSGSHLEAQF